MSTDGIWILDVEEQVETPGSPELTLSEAFVLKDGLLTIRLFTLQDGVYKSPDDFYKLKAKIEKGTLFYLPPFGDWVPLAAFDSGRYLMSSQGTTRYFKKVSADQVPKHERGMLSERAPHDYRIRADGTLSTAPRK